MTQIPYTFSGKTLSAFVSGKLYTIPNTHTNYGRLTAYLQSVEDHDEELALELLDIKTMISRLTAGKVTVVGSEVFYKGLPTRSALTEKLLALLEENGDAEPWANFLNNLMLNPSERSKECAFNFIENHATPLTPDGCFVAWKYVREDFGSAHESPDGTRHDNSPGKTVKMDRELVDDDPTRTCSAGLHVCASPYLGGYSSNAKVVKVKVNPRDICAVPTDYSFQKMRVCEYHVLEEVLSEAEILRVDMQLVTEDSSVETSGAIPDDLAAMPVATTNDELLHMYDISGEEVSVGDYVHRAGNLLVGHVLEIDEDCDYPDGSDGDIEYFWTFRILWQTGFTEDVILYDGEMGSLSVVNIIKDDIDTSDISEQGEEFFAKAKVKKLEPKIVMFKHARSGTEIDAVTLAAMVQKNGQRGTSKLLNVPRSTLQGWLSSI